MLQKRGISYSKGKGVIDLSIPSCQTEEQPPKPVAHKKPKLDKTNLTANASTCDQKDTSTSSGASDFSGSIPGLHPNFFLEFDCKSSK